MSSGHILISAICVGALGIALAEQQEHCHEDSDRRNPFSSGVVVEDAIDFLQVAAVAGKDEEVAAVAGKDEEVQSTHDANSTQLHARHSGGGGTKKAALDAAVAGKGGGPGIGTSCLQQGTCQLCKCERDGGAESCMGVAEAPIKPPHWNDAALESEWPPSGKLFAGVGAKLLGMYVPEGFGIGVETLVDLFWPTTHDNKVISMIDTMSDWVVKFTNQAIQEQNLKNLMNRINGYKDELEDAKLMTHSLADQIEKMRDLDTIMGTDAEEFMDTTLSWQAMYIFPTFVSLHLSVKSYIFSTATTTESQTDTSSIVDSRITKYSNRASELLPIILKHRMSFRSESTSSYRTHYSEAKYSASDTWSGCGWELPLCLCASKLVCPTSVGKHCVDLHFSAVEANWNTFWSSYLITPQTKWAEFGQTIKSKIGQLNPNVPTISSDLSVHEGGSCTTSTQCSGSFGCVNGKCALQK